MTGMTNEEAMQRLAQDENDAAALIAIAENSSETLKAAVERYFLGPEKPKKALLTLLVHISSHAKEFVPGQDAGRWIEAFAEMWCTSMQKELKASDGAENQCHNRLVSEGFRSTHLNALAKN